MSEDEATLYGRQIRNVRSILKMLPQVPHPGFAISLAWLMLRQDTATRVRRCDDDESDLIVIANLLACGVGVDYALREVLNATTQTDKLERACEGLKEDDLVLSPELAAQIGTEIRHGVLETMRKLKTDDQGRYMLRLFVREFPSTNEAVEPPQEPQSTS